MAKAKKLKSGSWRCLVYSHTDKIWDEEKQKYIAKRIYESFTADSKKEAEFLAADFSFHKKSREKRNNMTFGGALNMYITSRASVLSAGTIREYRRSQKADFRPIEQTRITDITQYDIQLLINEKSKNCKPKTVRNLHGLISAVMKEYRNDFVLNTTLPQKQKPDLYIPTDEDIQKLINAVNEDTDMLIAVYLAAFGPLRRSEICGLESTDIINKVAHVQRAVIMNEHNNWITKPVPKSVAGDRYIPLPDFVYDLLQDRQGRIISLHPNNITDRFEWVLKRAGLPHFRFHDLRHYCASIQHAMGIPDAYIMQRGGWGSDAVLKNVYRHALQDKSVQMNDIANKHFSELCNTKCNTKK